MTSRNGAGQVHESRVVTSPAPGSIPSSAEWPRRGADWRLRLPEARRRRLRRWFLSIAAMTFVVLVVGGITRLTQSGLSIVDWQPLVGAVPPLTDAQWQESFDRYRQFPQYRQLRPDMTLPEFKFIFFWEYLHRVVARLIGLVFLVPFAVFWARGYFSRPLAIRALTLFALGAMQGVLGWLMVRSGLVDRPSVSHYRLAAHLGLAFVIFGASLWLARDLAIGAVRPIVTARARTLMGRALGALGLLLALQIVWGALVAGLKAGFIYNTFPLMAGRLVPPDLLTLAPGPINFVQNLVTVQWMHRVLGTVLLAAAAVAVARVRAAGADQTSRRLSAALASLVAAQHLLGVLTLLYRVPATLGVIHQATAMVLAGVWILWMHHVRHLDVVATPANATRVG
jgi:cytochrome c oxidase assembly protein subunit 15